MPKIEYRFDIASILLAGMLTALGISASHSAGITVTDAGPLTPFQLPVLATLKSDWVIVSTGATVVPGSPGTYRVGLCVALNYDVTVHPQVLSGWVMVTD